MTYQNLIEELQLRHGLRSEAHKKQEWQALRLRYEGSLNRTVWDTFLIRLESQARELNSSESEKVQQFISVLPTGLQAAISKERTRVHRTQMSVFPPSVSQTHILEFLQKIIGKPVKIVSLEEGQWLISCDLQEEM